MLIAYLTDRWAILEGCTHIRYDTYRSGGATLKFNFIFFQASTLAFHVTPLIVLFLITVFYLLVIFISNLLSLELKLAPFDFFSIFKTK